jgi:hypothetical protein
MPVKRSVKKLFAVLLVPAAVAVAVQVDGATAGAGSNQAAASVVENQGNPNAVPPILRPATPEELKAIRRAEEREAARVHYQVPADARWSAAEMNAYASSAK